MQSMRPQFHSWDGKFPSDSKESACNVGHLGSIPGLKRFPGDGWHGNPLQYSCMENPHGQKSPAGYSPGVCKESDMTEQLSILKIQTRNNARYMDNQIILRDPIK